MSRWKKGLIWFLTFFFGLYYIVEFMFPEEIGGSIDRSGVGAATAVQANGWKIYYTAIAGPKKPDGSPDEKLLTYRITRFPIESPLDRQVVLAPSAFRKGDYFGCKNPSILINNDLWRMWYVGVSFDNRRPKVMVAESSDGLQWTGARELIPDPLQRNARLKRIEDDYEQQRIDLGRDPQALKGAGVQHDRAVQQVRDETDWLSGGIDSVCVRREGDGYRMWFVGKGPDNDSVGYASSTDGLRWVIQHNPIQLSKTYQRITSVTAGPNRHVWDLVFVADGTTYWQRYPDGVERPLVVETGRRSYGSVSVDLVQDGDKYLLTTSYLLEHGEQALEMFRGDPIAGWSAYGPEASPGPGGYPVFPKAVPTISRIASWVAIVSAFAVGIGLIGLFRIHVGRLFKRQSGWLDSGGFLVGLFAMGVALILQRRLDDLGPNGAVNPKYRLFVERFFDLTWQQILVPLTATMFSLLACFLVSAAYRAFRIRGRDATVLAISATIVLLAQVPIGDMLTNWMPPGMEASFGTAAVRQWYLDLANSAVQRGIAFGVFVGALAMALRIWLSLDRIGVE